MLTPKELLINNMYKLSRNMNQLTLSEVLLQEEKDWIKRSESQEIKPLPLLALK